MGGSSGLVAVGGKDKDVVLGLALRMAFVGILRRTVGGVAGRPLDGSFCWAGLGWVGGGGVAGCWVWSSESSPMLKPSFINVELAMLSSTLRKKAVRPPQPNSGLGGMAWGRQGRATRCLLLV